jgi:hypothetical protein
LINYFITIFSKKNFFEEEEEEEEEEISNLKAKRKENRLRTHFKFGMRL